MENKANERVHSLISTAIVVDGRAVNIVDIMDVITDAGRKKVFGAARWILRLELSVVAC